MVVFMFKHLHSKLDKPIINKVIWLGNKIFIEGYEKLVKITENEIHTTKYQILGDNLKIESLDGYLLEVTGIIEKIQRGTCDEHLQGKNE